jgi:pimeloyl-ACP methyl ester carboxylesterase
MVGPPGQDGRMPELPAPVPQSEIDDLRERLARTRLPALPQGLGWDRGVEPGYLAELVVDWRDRYDWRAAEERILALSWELAAGLPVIHQRAGADAPTVVLLHGWPDSVLRYEKVLPLLADVNVVVPSLPGYGYAGPLAEAGLGRRPAMADAVAAAVAELGYERFAVSGGDIGSQVAEWMAARHPAVVRALHLTDVPFTHISDADPSDLDDAGRAYQRELVDWRAAEGAYAHLQSTKPHTLAVGLGDSPAGLLAWVVEKLRSWSDCGGDVETVFPRDDLLTWASLPWLTRTSGSWFSPYIERGAGPEPRIEVPTAFTLFPRDITHAPRSYAERIFDVRSFVEEPAGGHFTAWEQPEAFVAGVRTALALL